jgi:acyl carrier protein
MGASRDEIRTALRRIAKDELRHEGPLPEGDLAEVFDSVQRLTLVVAVEDSFRICLDPEDEEGVRTLEDVVRLVEKKLGAGGEG